jgi:hypothetical protein
MRAAGPGSRGLIVAEWRFQPAGQDPRRPKAHVFNVMNIDGEVRFIDRQVRRRKLKLGLYTNFRFLLTQRGT